jgi:ubiquinone/menaquinone biosynthesis C-methylase UbiE
MEKNGKKIREYYEREAQLFEDHQRQMYFGSPWSRYWHETRLNHVIEIARNISFNSLLDAGCAEGFYIKILTAHLKTPTAVGLDIAKGYLHKAKMKVPNSQFVLGDAHNLPFKDNAFDLVLCSELLEHTLDPGRVLRELLRVSSNYVLITVAGENLPHYIARKIGLIKLRDPYSETGLGHIHELKIGEIMPLALKEGYKPVKIVLDCYFSPTFPEKYRMPKFLIRTAKILDKILKRYRKSKTMPWCKLHSYESQILVNFIES